MNSAIQWLRRMPILSLLAALLCAGGTLMVVPTADSARVLDTTIRMAFIYSGSPSEGAGWTYQHDLGRQAVENEFGKRVIVTIKEKVEVADVDTVIRNLVRDGNTFIISTSPEFAEAMLRQAKLSQKVQFEQVGTSRTAPNLAGYQIRLYEGAYLLGIIAGGMTKSKILGFVAPKATPEVLRNINAFTLGARAVKPGTITKVRWVDSWNDPARERELAEQLVTAGADVLAQNTESSAVMSVAEKRRVRAVGWNAELLDVGRYAQLTANLANWGPYYVNTTRNALNGIWSGGRVTRIGIREGAVILSPINPDVPANVISFAESRRNAMANDRFDPFRGPLIDNEGRERFKAGIAMLENELDAFDFFVEGVEGTIPKDQ